jgi:cytochrome c biogenesis protein CcmG/thiol:disulfide interchange protein DsbE
MRRATFAVVLGAGLALATGCSSATDDGVAHLDPTFVEAPPPTGPAANGVTDQVLPGLGDGPAVDLASYRGTPLVVNFFASTCPPCVEEMPTIQDALERADGDFAVVGVATNDDVDEAEALVEQTGVTWDIGTDPDGSLIVAAGGSGLPTTLFVDADGNIVDVNIGAMQAGDLAGLLHDNFGIDLPD